MHWWPATRQLRMRTVWFLETQDVRRVSTGCMYVCKSHLANQISTVLRAAQREGSDDVSCTLAGRAGEKVDIGAGSR